jgi:hypothetical protein
LVSAVVSRPLVHQQRRDPPQAQRLLVRCSRTAATGRPSMAKPGRRGAAAGSVISAGPQREATSRSP